jgi:uncharacterized integral membrane protein
MQFFLWLVLLVVIAVAIFTFQNSTAPPVVTRFLFWNLETSLIFTILLSVGSGILIVLPLWIRTGVKASCKVKDLKKEIEILRKQMEEQAEASKPLEGSQR